jgi:hypothetical protein
MSNDLVEAEMTLVNGVEGLAPAGVNVLLNNPVTDGFEREILTHINAFAGSEAHELLSHLASTIGAIQAKVPDAAKPLVAALLSKIQAVLAPVLDTPSTPADTAPSVGLHLTAAQVVALSKLSPSQLAALIGV